MGNIRGGGVNASVRGVKIGRRGAGWTEDSNLHTGGIRKYLEHFRRGERNNSTNSRSNSTLKMTPVKRKLIQTKTLIISYAYFRSKQFQASGGRYE